VAGVVLRPRRGAGRQRGARADNDDADDDDDDDDADRHQWRGAAGEEPGEEEEDAWLVWCCDRGEARAVNGAYQLMLSATGPGGPLNHLACFQVTISD
jgi:hypothetical protein